MLNLLPILIGASLSGAPVSDAVDAELAGAVVDYRWLHAHPELSGEEVRTAGRLATALEALDAEVHRGIGGHGVVGVMRNGQGPVVLYRADMDALPIKEATGVAYASTVAGVMHACGHDVHMATALGTLRVLHRLRRRWSGTVVFVGQPAEELGTGASSMLADPRMTKILARVGKPRVVLALHNGSEYPAGEVGLTGGFSHANVDGVDIIVHGKAGHGARPHQTVDPIVIGSAIVMSLQTIVSRRLKPGEKAVVTVGRFDGGTKRNIIPAQARLQLTVRSYGDEVRAALLAAIEEVAVNVAKAHGAPRAPEVVVAEAPLPAVYNDPAWAARIRGVLEGALGASRVHRFEASMGGEDFGIWSRRLVVPGLILRLGAVAPEVFARGGGPGLHSDRWAPPAEATVRSGMLVMGHSVLAALQ